MICKKIPLWEGRRDVNLYTFLAEEDPMLPGEQEKLPAIIICPGGAYMYCAMSGEGDPIAMHFASAGYQAFVLHYTVGTACGNNDSRYPAQIYDLAKAFLTIRENAAKWNVDAERIALCGFSAGAHLCATFATRWHEDFIANKFGVDSECFRPTGAILGYPLIDYEYQQEYNNSQPPNPMLLGSNEAFFGTENPDRELLREVSPYLHVTENTPPIFMMHASNDSMVPVMHSITMANALREHNIPFELHIFARGEHGFGTGRDLRFSIYRADHHKACGAWLPMAQKWLLQLFAPETAEKDISSKDFLESGSEGEPMPLPSFFR